MSSANRTIQKNLPRNNNGSRNHRPCPNPQSMEMLSFSVLLLWSWQHALLQAMFYSTARRTVGSYHGSSLFCERYDISFYSLEQRDISLYSCIRYVASWVVEQE